MYMCYIIHLHTQCCIKRWIIDWINVGYCLEKKELFEAASSELKVVEV